MLESRKTDDGLRRRRQCVSCGTRFSTVEARVLAPAPKIEPSKQEKSKKAPKAERVKARRAIEDYFEDIDIGERYRW